MRKDLFVIFILIILVIISQYYLLGDSLTLGFKPDDWILYFSSKLLGPNPLSQIPKVWAERGLYTTYYVFYMGLLDSLFGLNYYAFHLSGLILKGIAVIGLYPLILIIFKKRLLASLAVILFAISPAAVGPLEFVVKSSDYLAIIAMEAFLLIYYLLINNQLSGRKYYLILFILFVLSFSFSPIRMFPLFLIPPLLEIFLILKNFHKTIKKSLIRLSILYLPFIIGFVFINPFSAAGHVYEPIKAFKETLEGNWYLILAPFSGMGYSFITNNFWGGIFGYILTNNFNDYFTFILGGPTIIFGLITALIAWCLIAKNRILFFLITTLLNFTTQVLFFFIAFHHLSIPYLNVNYNTTNLYSVIFGSYVFIVGLMTFLFWLKWGIGNRLSASFWMGSVFLFIFTFFTWVFAPIGTGYNSTSYYLIIASIGASLMMAAFLVSIYEKLEHTFKLLAFIPLLILIPIFQTNSSEIRHRYSSLNNEGRGLYGQILMQQEARRSIKNYREGDFALFYFNTSDITGYEPFYSEGFLTSFPFFMHFNDNKVIDGCIGIIYDSQMSELSKVVWVQKGKKGFSYPSLCVEEGKSTYRTLFFNANHFYAFKIKDKKLIDIKEDVLSKLMVQ